MGGKAEEAWGRYAEETDCVASMCGDKIHLFDKSREFGFSRLGPDGRCLPRE
jgi:hypothetical protein